MKTKKMNTDTIISRIKVAIFAAILVLLVSIPIIGIYTLVSINHLNTTLASLETRLNQVDLENTSLDEAIDRIDTAISKLETSKEEEKPIVTPEPIPEVVEPSQEPTTTENIFPSAYDVQITTTAGLRVRSEPSVSSEIITVLPYNTIVTIKDDHNSNWYQLGDHYKNGYIFKGYTSTEIKEIDVTDESIPKGANPLSANSINIYEPSNLTAEEFNEIIETFAEARSIDNSALIDCGDALVALEENYNFNGLFALSVSGLESGFGITNAAQNYNNPLGIMTGGKIKAFDSIDEAFDYFGKFMSKNYFGNGRNTISSIGSKYCPSTATKWASDVTWFWNKLTAYV